MTYSNLFKPAFIISLLAGIIGAALKILHLPGGNIFLIVSFVALAIYVVIALYEIYSSPRVKHVEKAMWTIGFLLFSVVTAILYYFLGRPRILREYKVL